MIIKIRRVLYITLGLISKFIPNRKHKITVLCYHSVDSTNWSHGISKNKFRKQMKYLSQRYDFWNLYDYLDFVNGKKILDRDKVVITFDDGYKNILNIIDVANEFSIKPTVFIISESNIRNYGELENHKCLLSDTDIDRLLANGWAIGSHTATHPNLSIIDSNKLIFEIKDSKSNLEKRFGLKCDFIAFPKGKYTDEVLNITRKSGYKLGLTMDDGFVDGNTNLLKIPRIGINRTHSDKEFKYLDSYLNVYLRKISKYYLYD